VAYLNHDSVVVGSGFPVSTKFGRGVTEGFDQETGIVTVRLFEWNAMLYVHKNKVMDFTSGALEKFNSV
jgi:hypothetical protein